MKDKDEPVWFAMSAPHCKELNAKALLDRYAIENFVPMRYGVITKKDGSKRRELVPAIHNLIFVRTTRPIIQQIKTGVAFLQYRTKPEKGSNVPIIVPDYQMAQFIAVCRNQNERLLFLQPDEINLTKGTPVRILGGPFDGIEGVFVKVKGARSKRVVVQLRGIAAVAITEIAPDLIEVIGRQ